MRRPIFPKLNMSANSSEASSPPLDPQTSNPTNKNGESSNSRLHPVLSVTTPREKKKRVGFAGDPSPPKEEEIDYFSHIPPDSANNTPGIEIHEPARRDSFDKAELTEALEKILKPEDHSGTAAAQAIAANLRLPARPALRKTSYPESPAEPVAGLSHPSEIEARNRAGRLAESVSRTSLDLDDDSQYGLLDGTVDARDYAVSAAEASGAGSGASATTTGVAMDAQIAAEVAEGLTYRKKAETDADRLVRKHTKHRSRGQAPAVMTPGIPDAGIRSGTVTPVAYDLEYVPKAPNNHYGGVLGTLLKLYSAEDKQGSGSGSGQTTPNGGRTPNRTPRNSPPSTVPGTPRSEPPSRPRSGLFGLGSRHSASTLAELIGSSSTLVAPASSGTSDVVNDKLRKERERPKKDHKRKSSKLQKANEYLITKQ